MDRERFEQITQLLQTAAERQKSASDESTAYNLLSVLQLEYYETQTHSKIILFLLNSKGQEGEASFLALFLERLRIPRKYLGEPWMVYRERAFDGGSGRIDFVLESKSFCAIIEMKVEAGDGEHQLARYASFAGRKRKEYRIYYLTLDGRAPDEQSVSGMDEGRLWCISFQREIASWLQACMNVVKKDGYQYSFLKQYLAAVRHITGTGDEVVNVKDLLNSSDMARAAQIVAESFYEKMDDITAQFFKKLDSMIRRKTGAETYLYPKGNTVDIFLHTFTYRKSTYHILLSFTTVDVAQLIVRFIFAEKTEDDDWFYLPLKDAEAAFPRIYREWIDKLEALDHLPKFKRFPNARWLEVEDARGAQFNFKDYSAQISLMDEMSAQCKYISDSFVKDIWNPLCSDC